MNLVYLVLGVVLLVLAIVDALWTALWIDGSAGPLSTRLTTWLWRGIRAITPDRHHRTLSLAGPLILVATLVAWVLLIWTGWTLVFASSEQALMSTIEKGTYADWTGRIFFVAYAMFTMGNGDFAPQGDVWPLAASLTTASGMVLITLVVSYVLSVLSAVVNKRAFASEVTGLGQRSEDLLQTGWNGTDFHALDLPLNALGSTLSQLTEQHLAYPILHYYHSRQAHTAIAPSIVVLDEALTILEHGIPKERGPNRVVVRSLRNSLDSYLETLNTVFIHPAERVPDPPDLDRLREAGIPTHSDTEFADALRALQNRRKKLLGMIHNASWQWPPT